MELTLNVIDVLTRTINKVVVSLNTNPKKIWTVKFSCSVFTFLPDTSKLLETMYANNKELIVFTHSRNLRVSSTTGKCKRKGSNCNPHDCNFPPEFISIKSKKSSKKSIIKATCIAGFQKYNLDDQNIPLTAIVTLVCNATTEADIGILTCNGASVISHLPPWRGLLVTGVVLKIELVSSWGQDWLF